MTILKKTLLALGVVGIGSIVSAPAFAQNAYVSGASAMTLMNGATQSVGAELSLPTGGYFTGGISGVLQQSASPVGKVAGAVVVTPTLQNTTNRLATNVQSYAELVVDAGLPATGTSPTIAGATFTSAAAAALIAAPDLQAQVSIIRAGAGVDGLD